MAYAHASRYANAILNAFGTIQSGISVNVYLPGTTTAATLYTDHGKGTTAANPTTTDGNGNLLFWADPGEYDLNFTPSGGVATTVRVVVPVNPLDVGESGWAFQSKTGAYTALPGDFVEADTTSAAWTLTLPASPPADTQVGVKLVAGSHVLTISPNVDGASRTLSVVGNTVVLVWDGSAWKTAADSYPAGTYVGPASAPQVITSSTTGTVPVGMHHALVVVVGGGGGGGGAGSALTAGGVTNQVGGSGGGQGESRQALLSVNPGDTWTSTVAAGAGGGGGGTANGNPGSDGSDGSPTTFVVSGNTLTAVGGGHGRASNGNDNASHPGGAYAIPGITTTTAGNPGFPGSGGMSATFGGVVGGGAIGAGIGGGGAGCPATATLGGSGGQLASAQRVAPGYLTTNTATTAGGAGAAAGASDYGAGGAGGGGGAPGGVGGAGGAGGPGLVIVTWLP